MEIQGVLKNLREKNNLTQEQLAERVQVTRQAVSRWETGETQPNTDTLKLLSRVFDVSINTLLGSPRQLVCQCCGMPLNEDGLLAENQTEAITRTIVNGAMLMGNLHINPRNLCWIIWLRICQIPITQMKKPDVISLICIFRS